MFMITQELSSSATSDTNYTQEISQFSGQIAPKLIGNSPKDEHFAFWILHGNFV